mmetsp:Transcript_52802/g.170188  ORF Transcript_52802/g.170188 Transcript_52802/m.170188 type:complete len:304 (-) Transcript_52802:379-1290(-)
MDEARRPHATSTDRMLSRKAREPTAARGASSACSSRRRAALRLPARPHAAPLRAVDHWAACGSVAVVRPRACGERRHLSCVGLHGVPIRRRGRRRAVPAARRSRRALLRSDLSKRRARGGCAAGYRAAPSVADRLSDSLHLAAPPLPRRHPQRPFDPPLPCDDLPAPGLQTKVFLLGAGRDGAPAEHHRLCAPRRGRAAPALPGRDALRGLLHHARVRAPIREADQQPARPRCAPLHHKYPRRWHLPSLVRRRREGPRWRSAAARAHLWIRCHHEHHQHPCRLQLRLPRAPRPRLGLPGRPQR